MAGDVDLSARGTVPCCSSVLMALSMVGGDVDLSGSWRSETKTKGSTCSLWFAFCVSLQPVWMSKMILCCITTNVCCLVLFANAQVDPKHVITMTCAMTHAMICTMTRAINNCQCSVIVFTFTFWRVSFFYKLNVLCCQKLVVQFRCFDLLEECWGRKTERENLPCKNKDNWM